MSQRNCFLIKDARVHYVVLKQQPHHTPTRQKHPTTPPTRKNHRTPPGRRPCAGNQETNNSRCCSRTQQCAKRITTRHPTTHNGPFQHGPEGDAVLKPGSQAPIIGCFVDIPPLSNPPRNNRSRNGLFSSRHQRVPCGTPRVRVVLLRKEVIQPHLPVRLPCYDLVPIASPTFDHSLPCGLGHGLRVLPTFVT